MVDLLFEFICVIVLHRSVCKINVHTSLPLENDITRLSGIRIAVYTWIWTTLLQNVITALQITKVLDVFISKAVYILRVELLSDYQASL